MHIESVGLRGYRGLDLEVPLTGPLAVVVGPNNSGKSAVVDAIRTVLTPHAGRLGQNWIQGSDFSDSLDPLGELEIAITFGGVPDVERGRLITVLAPSLGADKARLSLKASRTAEGRVVTRFHGGDFGQNDVEPIAREALQYVYLPPLRDAVGDLKPGPSNKLPALVAAFAPVGHPDREALVQIAQDANERLETVQAIADSSNAIQDRLAGITGTGAFAYLSSLRFTPSEYDRIVSTLQALAGADDVAHLQRSGLGYNNLVYVAVVLAALQHETDSALSILLVEEPEAHLHPQLQSLLMRYLEELTLADVQVIATTHSPQFASTAQVERVTALSRLRGAASTAHALHGASLTQLEFRYLRRFLDVTKSSLLFAEGVILVEGIAEQLTLPSLATRLGISLAELGIAIVNVDGVAFSPFIGLFSSNALPTRCAVISDSDPYTDKDGTRHSQSPRAAALLQAANSQVAVHLASQTFEWDLAYVNASDPEALLQALAFIHPQLAGQLRANFPAPADPEAFANALLDSIGKSKGRFAQSLVEVLSNPDVRLVIPNYVAEAVRWAAQR